MSLSYFWGGHWIYINIYLEHITGATRPFTNNYKCDRVTTRAVDQMVLPCCISHKVKYRNELSFYRSADVSMLYWCMCRFWRTYHLVPYHLKLSLQSILNNFGWGLETNKALSFASCSSPLVTSFLMGHNMYITPYYTVTTSYLIKYKEMLEVSIAISWYLPYDWLDMPGSSTQVLKKVT